MGLQIMQQSSEGHANHLGSSVSAHIPIMLWIAMTWGECASKAQ